ncbi:MAG: hypothetical protein RL354_2600, partial [Planctomycetota bacterium]
MSNTTTTTTKPAASAPHVHPGARLRNAMSRGTVFVPGAFNALV